MSDETHIASDSIALDASVDGQTGTASNGKQIWTPDQIAAYFNRSGTGWNNLPGQATQSDSNLAEIQFGFHTSQTTLGNNGYTFIYLGGVYGVSEYFNFAPFSAAQQAAAREALQSWDDVISVSLREASNINGADISFGNLASAPTTQAYAYLPSATIRYYNIDSVNAQLRDLGGDVWVSLSAASNLQLDEGRYGLQTLTHEIGHALGLSHPGAYNAAPGLTLTYAANADIIRHPPYSIMSYFEASSLGARHFDFNLSTTAYAGVPLIHDILAAQRIYGADMTTRTGDTVYGFNSTAGRDAFDFVKTPAPIGAIWDAGGIDTLDTSGFATTQLIDLRAGSLSSIGGVTYDTAPTFAQMNANRAASGLAPLALATYNGNMAALLANPVVGRLRHFGNRLWLHDRECDRRQRRRHDDRQRVTTSSTACGNDTITGAGGNDTLNGGLRCRLDGRRIAMTAMTSDQSGHRHRGGWRGHRHRQQLDQLHARAPSRITLTGTAATAPAMSSPTSHLQCFRQRLDGGIAATRDRRRRQRLYFVDNGGDLVAELVGEGTDTVSARSATRWARCREFDPHRIGTPRHRQRAGQRPHRNALSNASTAERAMTG